MKGANRTHKKRRGAGASKSLNCHPGVQGKTVDKDTCYTATVLQKIRRSYNRTHKKTPIRAGTSKKVLQELKERMRDRCTQEDCWIDLLPREQQAVVDSDVFAPDQPREWKTNPHEWLSNFDLIKVLDQYEDAYTPKTHPERAFKYIGPTPIDFDTRVRSHHEDRGDVCVWEELCTFELARYQKQGYRKLGIVFNLDKHDQNGSHWVSLFVDLEHRFVFYFDSVGNPAPAEIRTLMERIVRQSRQFGRAYRVYENAPMQHQFGDTECGMYSLYFIVTMLTDHEGGIASPNALIMKDKLDVFRKRQIPDQEVAVFRHRYFN